MRAGVLLGLVWFKRVGLRVLGLGARGEGPRFGREG